MIHLIDRVFFGEVKVVQQINGIVQGYAFHAVHVAGGVGRSFILAYIANQIVCIVINVVCRYASLSAGVTVSIASVVIKVKLIRCRIFVANVVVPISINKRIVVIVQGNAFSVIFCSAVKNV